MVDEGLISREEAVARIDPAQLDQLLHPMLDPEAPVEVAAKGLNASPGAAVGAIVFDADTAEARGRAGEHVILVRWETTPDDIHGMLFAQGILTAHGGMTSHAAVVARGMGKPCVAGLRRTDPRPRREDRAAGQRGAPRGRRDHPRRRHRPRDRRRGSLVPPQINEDFQTVLEWADDVRRLRVRANADNPEDAARAREFGAQGIGLCRTEHMFFGDRLPLVQEMILASPRRTGARRSTGCSPSSRATSRGSSRRWPGCP